MRCRVGGELDGVFLPDLRPFILCVPGALFDSGTTLGDVELSSTTVYVATVGGELWEASLPHERRGRK